MKTTGSSDDLAAEPAADPLSLERQVCFALAVASRNVISVYRPVLEELDLTHPQYLVMLALWEDAPLSLSEIGRLLQLELATLSPLVKRLEAIGYVTRSRDPKDERSIRIGLTPTGARLRERALAVPVTVMERLRLDESDVLALHAALTPLIERSREALTEARQGRG
ncbi:DNA-binding MarR family transcriptional regulator [Friedmanniella endophytica]|uniref:DNA-binding MarR family transcriptional regulator n=1 Tax=Microlunatus kandeliicorticis TaxID=1759536 RepID=A0A7W3IRW7_9ACTN|nr:MarR family transcriptional regulator [Microlunatus kandeliicorticis]MBA8794122.1 DNA-binding MarR family transcriptional regulator [Microlunatus kandeliicorticis]